MPMFEYICADCGEKYDILFKGSEKSDMIACPACTSRNYTKKFSTFSASVSGAPYSSSDYGCASGTCGVPAASPCASGMCGLG